jgi:hypothetical protein
MYPLDIPGITGQSLERFMFNEHTNEQTILQLVDEIPPELEVVFYDKDFPSRSDPGAYVTFRRFNSQYIMQRGNHGWSTNWEPITVGNLVDYLSKCSKYNMGPGFPNLMFAYPAVKTPALVETPAHQPKKWWEVWK